MNPVLYEQEEKNFTSNGIGRPELTSCIVSERLNDFYTLEAAVVADSKYADDVKVGRLLLATPSDGMRPQPFRIYEVDKNLDGTIQVLANHISYDLSGYPMREYTASTCAGAVASLSSRAIISSGFSFSTDITKSAAWVLEGAASVRSCMGGENGLVSVYGGEWYYDRYECVLKAQRGSDNGVSIRYGKNLTELDAIYDDTEDYTGALAWYLNNGTYVSSNIQYLDQYAVPQKILIVDHSGDYQSTPSTADLNADATADLAKAAGITKSITVGFIPTIEHVKLGDYVTVIYDKYQIKTKLEVVQTDYNVLLDRYDSIELGAIRPTLADTIANLSK